MTQWSIDTPQQLTFDEVTHLRVQLADGQVDVVATTGQPRLDVTSVEGPPLLVKHEHGQLTVCYQEEGFGPHVMRWLAPWGRRSAAISLAVPASCPVAIQTASAPAFVSSMGAGASVHSAAGPVTLDGVSEQTTVKTASGDVEAHGLAGRLDLGTVSGDLTLASSSGKSVKARTVSGQLTIDLESTVDTHLNVGSVSGDVAVRLPETADLSVDLRSVSGQLGAAFSGLRHRRQPGHVTARGRIGNGSGRLSANTVSGDVALLNRQSEFPKGPPGSPRTGPATTPAEGRA